MKMMAQNRPTIAVPVGDPTGIGPEIVLKAALDPDVQACARPILIADKAVIAETADRLGCADALRQAASAGHVELLDLVALEAPAVPGTVTAAAGRATIAYARAAIALVAGGRAAAVVAGPHNETAVALAGIRFSGYPGLLAEATGVDPDDVFLMLISPRFRIVHATLHVGLRRALDSLTTRRIADCIRATDTAMRRMGFDRPRIGVAGINPHAGEGGLFGDEDERIAAPAVAAARADGIDADGPTGADLLLAAGAHDAYVVMFHDQGHIPVKLEGRGNALGVSIGAPVLLSTVAHGSAHDIAGTGRADPSALAGAMIKMADILKNETTPEGRRLADADRV